MLKKLVCHTQRHALHRYHLIFALNRIKLQYHVLQVFKAENKLSRILFYVLVILLNMHIPLKSKVMLGEYVSLLK